MLRAPGVTGRMTLSLPGTARSRNLLARLLCCIALWVIALPAVGAEAKKNPHYQTALKLYEAFEYEEALRVLEKAEQWPSNTRDDDVDIALLEGVLAFETQQIERGKGAFWRALKMDPGAKLKLAVSPKIAGELEEVRKGLKSSEPITLPPEPVVQPGSETLTDKVRTRLNLKLPVAIGGGALAVGGLVFWTRAKSLDGKVRRADPSITTRAQLDDTLQQAKTFQTVGWTLMGVGAVAAAGSLLLLDSPAEGTKASIIPVEQGAQVSLSWSLP